MCNFIIGQVTPKMLEELRYGTYIFFGLFTTLGALFIAFFVPETKQLTLEEMDAVFGEKGVAEGDARRLEAVNRDIGLESLLERMGGGNVQRSGSASESDEKAGGIYS